MKKAPSYFCPDDGWEGFDPVCPICGQPSESLETEEGNRPAQTQVEREEVAPGFEPLDDFEEPEPEEEKEDEL